MPAATASHAPDGASKGPAKEIVNGKIAKGGGNESKKRKRNGGKQQAKEVNKDNLADMWDMIIEGKPKAKKTKVDGDKSQKVAGVGDAARVQDQGVEVDEVQQKTVAPSQDVNSDEGVKKTKSRKDKKRDKKEKEATDSKTPGKAPIPASSPVPAPPATKLTPLQASMRQKLISARFRQMNETLYTKPSEHSLSLFTEDPQMFNEYHEGFRQQVEVWPENPVDTYIASIKSRGIIKGHLREKSSKDGEQKDASEAGESALPRTGGRCNIADLGCGDAAISTALQPSLKKLHLKVHSFDLHSPSPLVTKADIASLPLPDNSIDVAIFCLALMGTNWIDFIEEAFRILRWKGELWIAEIKSRFSRGGGGSKVVDHSVGNRKKNNMPQSKEAKKIKQKKEEEFDDAVAAVEVDGQSKGEETDVAAFVEVLRKRGFVLKGEGKVNGKSEGVDLRNKMFVRMHFIKGTTPVKGKGVPVPKGMEEITGEGTWKRKAKGKFLADDEPEEVVGSEAKVLKPCVYKLR